jgi:hypothetical protein
VINAMRHAYPSAVRRFFPNKRVCALGAAGLALALAAPVSVAGATPTITITAPKNGALTHDQTPRIEGTTEKEFDAEIFSPVKVNVYQGTTVEGAPVRELTVVPEAFAEAWSTTVTPALESGTYTARAEQSELSSKEPPGLSNSVTFTVYAAAPRVTITYPANGSSATGDSQLLTGSAGTGPRDNPEVTIELFAGSTTTPTPLATLEVPTSGASWSAVFGALQPGTYTAEAIQRDEAGNVGASAPVTFTLLAPPVHPIPPPAASFSWFPPAPVVGQTVVLASSSTDSAGGITSFAWDLAGNGPFRGGGPLLSTSFATPGSHVVRLQVVDARGASSVATETIPVGQPPLKPMQPFPIVRIAGFQTGGGVRLSLVSVQAPVGARVTVTCRGRGCRMKPQSRVASANKHNRHASSVVLTFGSFERSFRAGTTLEVRVSAPGKVGKYTLFAIHRRSLPTRVDECLSALDPNPVACAT